MSYEYNNNPPALPKQNSKMAIEHYMSMPECKVIEAITNKCAPSEMKYYGADGSAKYLDTVVITPSATEELYAIVHFGERHPNNLDEQLFRGLGHIIIDGSRRIVVVSHFQYIYACERTRLSAFVAKDGINPINQLLEYETKVINRNEIACNKTSAGYCVDPFVDEREHSVPVLYGHTHPNLGVFFSGPDRTSGFATPTFPAVTFVIDPIRKLMKAGVGVELRDARIIVFEYVNRPGRTVLSNKEQNANNEESFKTEEKAFNAPSEVKAIANQSDNADAIMIACNNLVRKGAKGRFASYTTPFNNQHIFVDLVVNDSGKKKVRKKLKLRKRGADYGS